MIRKIRTGAKKLSEVIALLSVELLLVFISFFISIAILIMVIRLVFYHKNETFDQRVFSFLSHYVSDANTSVMQFFTMLGSHKFLLPAFVLFLIYYFFIRKNKWDFIKITVIALFNLLLMFSLKFFFNRHRPLIPLLKEVPGLSFPSGHAFMSLTFFGLLIYVLYRDVSNKWIKWIGISLLALIILLVGLSRVYLRVHYASDVIAGYCFGLSSLLILLGLLRIIERYNARKIPTQLNFTVADKPVSEKNNLDTP